MIENLYIFDCEVFIHDWLFVFKHKQTKEYTVIWNDREALEEFMQRQPLLAGFNNKHYDQFILKGALVGLTPEEIKELNDYIILEGHNGWEHPAMRNSPWFDQYDLMDDCQAGLSLKAIEAHLGMDIKETEVSFDIDRYLTDEERELTVYYCKHDVDATDKLDDLRQDYIKNKLKLGQEIGLTPEKALYMTNAKLTATYLGAKPPEEPWTDEREYQYPPNLKREYIPAEVFEFFDRIHNPAIPSNVLFSQKLEIMVGDCPTTLAYGGIHGAIPTYSERATDTRSIRNQDVASYYPHLMTLCGYTSRNIPSAESYEAMLERRIKAKRSGDKATANALKLVANTTYGAMLSEYNNLYDPLMGRSVCVSGQLFLLEMAEHLIRDCPTVKVVQLNTDGIMISLDNSDLKTYQEIVTEWQQRTGFELEEDLIKEIIQKDVNNYCEVPFEGNPKIKGGVVVRGIAPAGAFNINNNANVIARAVVECLSHGTPVEETINGCDTVLDFQFVAKSWAKCGNALHFHHGTQEEVQRVNRVYATDDYFYGTLMMYDSDINGLRKIPGIPAHCLVDNDNHLTINDIDKRWYIRQANRYVRDFLGQKPPKRNTRAINKIKKQLLEVLSNGS